MALVLHVRNLHFTIRKKRRKFYKIKKKIISPFLSRTIVAGESGGREMKRKIVRTCEINSHSVGLGVRKGARTE